MCSAVRFDFDGQRFEYRFTQYQARLPLLLKTGYCSLVSWGRRRNEVGSAPFGASVRLASIQAGRWDALQPKPVKIAVQGFMETDVMGHEHWFQVMPGQYIQGMLIQQQNQLRVYTVQLDCNGEDTFFQNWPRIVNSPF